MITLVRLASTPATQVLASELDGLASLPPGPWAILDCDFGVPLFSAPINELVCAAILKQKLWEPDNLQKLVQSSDLLERDFLRFIGNIQVWVEMIDKVFTKICYRKLPIVFLIPSKPQNRRHCFPAGVGCLMMAMSICGTADETLSIPFFF